MTYRSDDVTASATGRRIEIDITPEMIEAGMKELVFDYNEKREYIVHDVLLAALTAGGYVIAEEQPRDF